MPSIDLSAVDLRLFRAIEAGDAAGLRQALVDGANPNAEGPRGRTPLHAATENHSAYHSVAHQAAEHVADGLVRLLVVAGAHPDALNKAGESPLHNATRHGFHAVMRRLISLKADVNRPQPNGAPALLTAMQRHDHRAMELLLKNGAVMNRAIKATNHKSLWDWAFSNAEKQGMGAAHETFMVMERFKLSMSALFAPVEQPRLRVRL